MWASSPSFAKARIVSDPARRPAQSATEDALRQDVPTYAPLRKHEIRQLQKRRRQQLLDTSFKPMVHDEAPSFPADRRWSASSEVPARCQSPPSFPPPPPSGLIRHYSYPNLHSSKALVDDAPPHSPPRKPQRRASREKLVELLATVLQETLLESPTVIQQWG